MRLVDTLLEKVDEVLERTRSRAVRDGAIAAVLLAPSLAVLGVFGITPILGAVYLSLFDTHFGAGPFVGVGNYAKALTEEDFWKSFLVTFYYSVGTIPVGLVLSFAVALALFRILRARGLFRTMYFLPYVTSAVAAATVWRVLLHPQIGLTNLVLQWLGADPMQWLLEPRGVLYFLTDGRIPPTIGPSLSLCCVMLFDIWHASGFMIVIFLAGLTALPRQLEEAARIDGAGGAQVVWNVTLPLLSPTIFFLTVVSAIRSFQAFNSFFALTGDGRGPLNTTRNLTVYIYSSFYQFGYEGYGAALAALSSLAIVTMTIVQWRFAGRRVFYE
ncbi:MAG: sugar ABC transporter permease [Candidatus Hydrogenedentes bacterium]|nr:sugar ABC transporter permease [Candidatus Hydrogenedentota bacterium]